MTDTYHHVYGYYYHDYYLYCMVKPRESQFSGNLYWCPLYSFPSNPHCLFCLFVFLLNPSLTGLHLIERKPLLILCLGVPLHSIHSFNTRLLSGFSVPSIIPGAGDTAENKSTWIPALRSWYPSGRKKLWRGKFQVSNPNDIVFLPSPAPACLSIISWCKLFPLLCVNTPGSPRKNFRQLPCLFLFFK